MYLVQSTRSNQDKVVAGFVTAFFLLGTFLALHWVGLPEVRQRTDMYEEINWTRFRPKPKKIVGESRPKAAPKPEPVALKPQPKPAARPAAPHKVDLSALARFDTKTLSRPGLKESRVNPPHAVASSQKTRIALERSTLSTGLTTFTGDAERKLRLPNPGRRGAGEKGAPLLVANSGAAVEPERGPALAAGGSLLGAPQAKDASGGSVQLQMVQMSDLGGDFADLSPIYRELIEWLKRHRSALPAVVGRFMESAPGDLTAVVDFEIDGRKFQMFLLVKEALYEVRVCLIENNESTYLIDRGFKENSRYLRVGSVNRTPTGKILSFSTVRKAASNHRTVAFYQIFLSWWESARSQM